MMHAVQLELPLRFFRRIQCSAARVRAEQLLLPLGGIDFRRDAVYDDTHHLRQKENGYWQMRLTVDRGPKVVGERMIFGLGTRNVEEARARRDVLLAAMTKAGLVLKR